MDLANILNTVRYNQTADYKERIPEANRENMCDIQTAMLDENNIEYANACLNAIFNKIVKTIIHTKLFNNPLKSLKKGTKPLGDGVEEIYTNFIKGNVFDMAGSDLLKRELPDTKVVYHRKNYENQYTITVTRDILRKAFSSYEALESYIKSVIATLTSSAEYDEFLNTKNLIKTALENNALVVREIADPLVSEANGKEFIKTIKTFSGLMSFPSTEHNAYTQAQSTDTKKITTFSRKNEQILIIDTATDTSINVDVLASLFNMSVAEFNDTRKIVIDVFPESSKGVIKALLVDEAFFQIYDDLIAMTSFTNPKGLYSNYYLTVMQTFAYSILVNATAFIVEGTATATATASEEEEIDGE